MVTEYNTTPYRTLTGLRCGTTYHARVSAYGDGSTRAASWSEPSEPRSATPPCPPSIEVTGLADELEVGGSDVFRVRASHLNPAHAYAIRITTSNADVGFNASCSDREETARLSGVISYRSTLTLHGCGATTGEVTATLERGSTGLAAASQRVRVAEPVERPSEPTGFGASAGNTQVWLRWDDPGDGTITKWRYWIWEGRGRTEWRDVPGSGADTTSHRVTGLNNGIEYRFRVRAVNGAGEGRHTDPQRVTPVAALPAKPTGFAVASGEGELTESRAFIRSFVKEIEVRPGRAVIHYTIPTPEDSPIGGADAAEVALNGGVRSTVRSGGPTCTVLRTFRWEVSL